MQGVFIMEALWGRFCPAQQGLRALIRGGAIGEPLQGDARCAFLADFAHRRLIDPVLGGGGLLDVGMYRLPADVTGCFVRLSVLPATAPYWIAGDVTQPSRRVASSCTQDTGNMQGSTL